MVGILTYQDAAADNEIAETDDIFKGVFFLVR
jgi:hypothetical protein